MAIKKLLLITREKGASDLHLTVGLPPVLRIHGQLKKLDMPPLTPEDTKRLGMELLGDDHLKSKVKDRGQVDFAFSLEDAGRYRVNVFKQKGNYAASLRSIAKTLPAMETLGLPKEILQQLTQNTQGLILITGPTGSGKSTTLATMIDYINQNRACHILTLEDPIEHIYSHHQSMINQREIGVDTPSYEEGLRAALREDPDVILVGEMRDQKTIATAITAAETGHLVLSTLHTLGASQTIDRMIDVFPSDQQGQIKVQLANLIKGVMSQQLLTRVDLKGRCIAYEIMLSTPAISNLIREGKSYQINSQIQTGSEHGMETMDRNLLSLYKEGNITRDQAINHAFIPRDMKKLLSQE